MIDRAKANVFMTKLSCDVEDDSYQINAANMLHDHLTEKNKDRTDRLFGIYQIDELSLGIKFPTERSFYTSYEYEKSLITEDEQESWPAVLFVALLKAYGIDSDTLLEVGREAEAMSKEYIAEMTVEYDAQSGNQSMDTHKVHEKK